MVWLSTSPPGTCSAVLLFVLGSCRCGRHADTMGLVDDRQQSFFHMHGEIHRWSLVSTKHSQNVRTRGGYLIIYGCYNGRLRGAQGALSAQRALRCALCTSAPKIGAHSTSLPSRMTIVLTMIGSLIQLKVWVDYRRVRHEPRPYTTRHAELRLSVMPQFVTTAPAIWLKLMASEK